MKLFRTIIIYDYLQRTRTYAFLITLCASLAIAYTFVPEPHANYSTIRIADYIGHYNSAWFGYVTVIMTSVFLSLIGFYLVNSGIKKDIDTKIGQIIATTPISNAKYLLYKVMSNFLVLLTIVCAVFLMSIVLFFLYNDGYPLEIYQFVKPYILVAIPSVLVIAAIAVFFEVVFGKYTILQNIGFFFLFSVLMFYPATEQHQFSLDVFGSKIVTHHMEKDVQEYLETNEDTSLNIGYVIGQTKPTKRFEFNGLDFPLSFILSRFVWISMALIIIVVIAPLFHRFDKKARIVIKKRVEKLNIPLIQNEIRLSKLDHPQIRHGVFTLIKTELMLLIKKGKKWHWVINLIGMSLLVILPLEISHQIVLPILWFLQVGRLSDLAIKDQMHHVHYFTASSYKPVQRILVSQFLSGFILMHVLSLPLLIRHGLLLNYSLVFALFLGGILIVVFAMFFGVLSKGKKLFEVLFFMITYTNINKVPYVDYFGAFEHHTFYLILLLILIIIFSVITTGIKRYELTR